ncbi:MAG: energy transducer TonB [Gammaproteobacteria bacterium]|jgi:protein TonB|nr:energy transducer TonB [Gammaproteobacteria bacterium]
MQSGLRYLFTGAAAVAVTMVTYYMTTMLIDADAAPTQQLQSADTILVDTALPQAPKSRERRTLPAQPVVPAQTDRPKSLLLEPELPIEPLQITPSGLHSGPGDSVIKGNVPNLFTAKTDQEALALTTIAPRYPQAAAQNHIEGWVTIEFVISAAGTVTEAKIIASQPAHVFDQAALEAIEKWTFQPSIANGRAVPRRAAQTINFNLAEA